MDAGLSARLTSVEDDDKLSSVNIKFILPSQAASRKSLCGGISGRVTDVFVFSVPLSMHLSLFSAFLLGLLTQYEGEGTNSYTTTYFSCFSYLTTLLCNYNLFLFK